MHAGAMMGMEDGGARLRLNVHAVHAAPAWLPILYALYVCAWDLLVAAELPFLSW